MNRFLRITTKLVTLSFVVMMVLSRCGKKEATSTLIDEAPSYYSTTKALFPTCNSGRSGYLAYATDESKFYTCDGATWNAVSIAGPTGAAGAAGATGAPGAPGVSNVAVYDKNGIKLGLVAFANWPSVAIEFNNAGVGFFLTDGTYNNGLCAGGTCSSDIAYVSTGSVYYTGVATNKSYPFYSTASCSSTPYVPNKPIKNSIFSSVSGSFVVASGTESMTTVSMAAIYLYDKGNCTTLVSGSGICCTNVISGSQVQGFPISTSYSFPGSISYPFAGPLYFQ